MVVAMPRPLAHRAHRSAVAEMRDDQPFAAGDPARESRRRCQTILIGQAMEAVAQDALGLVFARAARGGAPPPAGSHGRRCRSRRPAAGPGSCAARARIAAMLCGWWCGASGSSAASSRDGSRRRAGSGAVKRVPPWTTRWPAPASAPPWPCAASQSGSAVSARRGCGSRRARRQLAPQRLAPCASARREARRAADAGELAAAERQRRRRRRPDS